MADKEYDETQYVAPVDYRNAHDGADEANDLRYLHASAAVIRIGAVPVVAVENLTINQQINRSPINVIGSIAPLGFDVQSVSVNVSGQLVQLAKMSLNRSSFYPSSEADVIANINKVFNIDIVLMDYINLEDENASQTDPFITITNCQNTGSSITVNPNTMIKDSFTAIGTFMKRDWDALAKFNSTDFPVIV